MNTIEIKLAGLLFKVWYDAESYEVHEVKRFSPHEKSGWQALTMGGDEHVRSCLSPEVIMVAEL